MGFSAENFASWIGNLGHKYFNLGTETAPYDMFGVPRLETKEGYTMARTLPNGKLDIRDDVIDWAVKNAIRERDINAATDQALLARAGTTPKNLKPDYQEINAATDRALLARASEPSDVEKMIAANALLEDPDAMRQIEGKINSKSFKDTIQQAPREAINDKVARAVTPDLYDEAIGPMQQAPAEAVNDKVQKAIIDEAITNAKTAQADPAAQKYKIHQGDTLWDIATTMKGRKESPSSINDMTINDIINQIVASNNIKDRDLIYAGDTLDLSSFY